MSFSSGTFSINSSGQPVVTGTVISSTAFNSLTADLATGLSTCVLKDGTQTITANIPMAGFIFTGLGAGSANGHSVRWQQSAAGVLTTTGDTLYASSANTPARLAIGAAGALSMVASGLPSWLAIGTARQQLATNAGATAAEWVASLQSLMTGTGDIVQSSSANTPARLAIGTARQVPMVNAGATALAYTNPITIATPQATTSGTTKDFTSIPASVRRITVVANGVSSGGTSNLLVQAGTGGSPTTTGYVSGAHGYSNTFATSTAGFLMSASFDATNPMSGLMEIMNISGNIWVASFSTGTAVVAANGGGNVTLAGVLDNIRFTTVSGDTFDAGSVTITYE